MYQTKVPSNSPHSKTSDMNRLGNGARRLATSIGRSRLCVLCVRLQSWRTEQEALARELKAPTHPHLHHSASYAPLNGSFSLNTPNPTDGIWRLRRFLQRGFLLSEPQLSV